MCDYTVILITDLLAIFRKNLVEYPLGRSNFNFITNVAKVYFGSDAISEQRHRFLLCQSNSSNCFMSNRN